MNTERKTNVAKILAMVVGLAGIAVIIGWIFDITGLKSISPDWTSMKFDTALVFVLSGITLYFIARAKEGEFDQAQVTLSITTLIIILLMGILFFSALLGIHTGTEDLFIQDTHHSAMTVVPGRPSLPATVNFILIALAGILTLLNPEKSRPKLKIIGFIVAIIGALAVAGYCLNAPLLYYFLPGKNSAMALHTAALFVLSGIGLICLSD